MHPNEIAEPCFLDYADDPAGFEPPAEWPSGPSWWEGRWPAGGINSLDDLRQWVEEQFELMLDFQGYETLAGLGWKHGIQALTNADRYLGRFGSGNHPPRPTSNQLQQVEAVEDALEGVLRYLRQQGQPADSTTSPRPLEVKDAATAAPRKPRWVQAEANVAISGYILQQAGSLAPFREGAQANQKDAIEAARALAGRNEISRRLGISEGMVSKSAAYKQVAAEFNLHRDLPALNKSKKIGLEIAVERKAASDGDPVVEEVARREVAEFIRSKLDPEQEDIALLLSKLETGEISPEKVMEYAKVMLAHRDDTKIDHRPRRKPR